MKRVNVAANQFELKIGNIKGNALSALFRNGKTHLKKRNISQNTPLQREDCKITYQLLESAPKREAPECGPYTARGDNATHFFMWGIKNDYPGFPGKEFDAECVRHCKGKPLMTRASFYKKFCRIK